MVERDVPLEPLRDERTITKPVGLTFLAEVCSDGWTFVHHVSFKILTYLQRYLLLRNIRGSPWHELGGWVRRSGIQRCQRSLDEDNFPFIQLVSYVVWVTIRVPPRTHMSKREAG